MRSRCVAVAVVVFWLTAFGLAGSVGMFGGSVVEGAAKNPPGKWIYVKGRAGTLRRVEISRARFDYATSVPRSARSAIPADDLRDGTVVQVAAEQDGSGEWIARSVLILRLSERLARSAAH